MTPDRDAPRNGHGDAIQLPLLPHDEASTDAEGANGARVKHDRPRIALFIDVENAMGHLRNFGDVLSVERIRRILQAIGELRLSYAFVDVLARNEIARDLDRENITVVHCPRRTEGGQFVDQVDEHMRKHIRMALDNPSIDTIALVTHDNDFRDVILEARDRNRRVILLVGEPDASRELQRIADSCFCIGSEFLRRVRLATEAIRAIVERGEPLEETCRAHEIACAALIGIVAYAANDARFTEGFAQQFLRDCMRSDPHVDLPDETSMEELLRCIVFLRELGCFVPIEGSNRIRLNSEHPLVRLATIPAVPTTLDTPSDV
ncbi:MAG: NYN domain-containing protein [Candidatus Uhrbacteria bacterium]